MVFSWILSSVSKKILASSIYIDTITALWIELRERFSQSHGPQIFQLQKDISSLHQEKFFVSDYHTQLKTLCDKLLNFKPFLNCGCGSNCNFGVLKEILGNQQQEYVMRFLMGLNDNFSYV